MAEGLIEETPSAGSGKALKAPLAALEELVRAPAEATPIPCSGATSPETGGKPCPCWTNPWPSPANWTCGH